MDIRGDEGPFDEEGAEFSVETPEADAAEQHREVRQNAGVRGELPLEADPGDAADQDRVVDLDDDEYR
ncbi:hypothetical protein ETD86_48150 [Nonomuraea turkmeniaca]|uniref:DUF5709 domain-containing protein n=1 Tax=Nonomuraea turkmeniaca TaxID=103838 RepID=A0A5S4EXF0_9ACTN|nr:hypothetical protein [Nonomuraea turkmeniaca]TMR08358.1 hypothetical protein ETD86_48150 [Nonomuraea turkmeniaca]